MDPHAAVAASMHMDDTHKHARQKTTKKQITRSRSLDYKV